MFMLFILVLKDGSYFYSLSLFVCYLISEYKYELFSISGYFQVIFLYPIESIMFKVMCLIMQITPLIT